MLGTCGLPGNLLWPAPFEHHKLPLPPLGSLSSLLQVLIDPLLPYLIFPGSAPFLGYSFPFEVLWIAGFGMTADCVSKLGLYTVLMDTNRLTFSFYQSVFLLIHSRPNLHFLPICFISTWDTVSSWTLQQASIQAGCGFLHLLLHRRHISMALECKFWLQHTQFKSLIQLIFFSYIWYLNLQPIAQIRRQWWCDRRLLHFATISILH